MQNMCQQQSNIKKILFFSTEDGHLDNFDKCEPEKKAPYSDNRIKNYSYLYEKKTECQEVRVLGSGYLMKINEYTDDFRSQYLQQLIEAFISGSKTSLYLFLHEKDLYAGPETINKEYFLDLGNYLWKATDKLIDSLKKNNNDRHIEIYLFQHEDSCKVVEFLRDKIPSVQDFIDSLENVLTLCQDADEATKITDMSKAKETLEQIKNKLADV